MDSDTVDTTDRISDRFKRPGPRKQPMVDLKYITFGFSYLQASFATVIKMFVTFCFGVHDITYSTFLKYCTFSYFRICWNMQS